MSPSLISILSKLDVYWAEYFLFWIFPYSIIYYVLEFTYNLLLPYFLLLWTFMKPHFFECVLFYVCWKQHTKVNILLVNWIFLLWWVFWNNLLELAVDVVNWCNIILSIKFLELLNEVLLDIIFLAIITLILLFLLFCCCLWSFFFRPTILLGP